MAIILGLVAALFWGICDLLATYAGRGIGAWRALFHGDVAAVILLTLLLPLAHALGALPLGGTQVAWLLAILLAPIGLIASYALVQAMTVGTVAQVVPIMTGYGAIATVLAILSGEALGRLTLIGLAATIVGVALAAAGSAGTGRDDRAGIRWALVAALTQGVSVWLQGRYIVPELGAILTVWVMLTVGTLLLGLAGRVASIDLAGPPAGLRSHTYGSGILAALAYVALAIGLATGQTSVVAVLSTLSSAVTATLGVIFLRERLLARQWTGVGLILAGVAVLHLA